MLRINFTADEKRDERKIDKIRIIDYILEVIASIDLM